MPSLFWNANERKEWKATAAENPDWTVDTSIEPGPRQIDATAVVKMVTAKKERRVVETGALLDVVMSRQFAANDPGEDIIVRQPYGLTRLDSLRVGVGVTFVRDNGRMQIRDVSGVNLRGEKLPAPGSWYSLSTIAAGQKGLAGKEIGVRELFAHFVEWERSDEEVKRMTNDPELLTYLRRGFALEVCAELKALLPRDRVKSLDALAANDLVPNFLPAHLSSGLVLDLAEQAIYEAAEGLSVAQLIELSKSLNGEFA